MTGPSLIETLSAAMVCHRSGDIEEAELHYRRALSINPHEPEALYYLGLIVDQRGDSAQAIELLRCAVAVRTDDPARWNNLGNLLNESDQLAEAIKAYREAINLMPTHINANYNLGLALLKLGEADDAVAALRQTVELTPRDAECWNSLGEALIRAQSFEEALEAFRTAYRLDPQLAEACNNLGLALLDLGDSKSAIEHFHEALRLSPGMPEGLSNLARTRRFERSNRSELDEMMAALENPSLDERGKTLLHFAIGKVFDDCGDYEHAFEHYRAGNDLKAQRVNFDERCHAEFVKRTTAVFDTNMISRLARFGSDSETPVFIVGLPRSGSSLVEQIIASHPQAKGTGEIGYITEMCHRMGADLGVEEDYPECANLIDEPSAARFASGYLGVLGSVNPAALRVTDKMLTNFLFLGLINVLFPKAKIIHCRRDPRDVCLSNYFQLFGAGQFFSYRLDTIASYYHEFKRLMAHWNTAMTLTVHEVVYEDLVARQEEVSRELIAYCGLPWNDACLEFHRSKRAVHTASHWQVRQKIYHRSVGRWQHYERYLPESILALE